MAFELKYAVIHSFEKDKHATNVDPEKIVKKPLFDVAKPTVVKLVSSIHGALGKTGNNVVWGQFSEVGRQGAFPPEVASYIVASSATSFEHLTHTALDELVGKSLTEALSTGGYILFAQYLNDNVPFLLVTSIKQRDGLKLNADYIPEETTDIDMSKIQQAARINLSRLSEFLNPVAMVEDLENLDEEQLAEIEMEKEKTYLCFISKGKGSEASGYFVEALGCEKGVASARATRNAMDMVELFFKNREPIKHLKVSAREGVVRYLQQKIEDGHHATLEGIHAAATSCIQPEQADLTMYVEELKEFLNDEVNQVPEEFSVNQIALNQRIRIKGDSGRHWALQFEKGSLGTTTNSKVCYNRDEKQIILSEPTDKMCRLIEAALAADEVK
ncbi:nucleoid-associated protein [Pseudomonas azotoformans]|uniref:nucleoid-associated protein n=1 Tax=Pseudomonas azotoformans TaxID=47878 RepID=UPI0011467247|nr:nucleoid-associated protein [Pseudomonas azotoformans]QDH64139.1 nucleoid-associated protein [Pseudomonas azotoformans]